MLIAALSLLCVAAPVTATSVARSKEHCSPSPKRAQPAAAAWPKKAAPRPVVVLKTTGGGSGFWRQIAADLMP
jgi:hypothetical protein